MTRFPLLQPSAPKGSEEYIATYQDEWREVFIISAEIYIFGMLIYLILADGNVQSWAKGTKSQSVALSPDECLESGRDTISAKMPHVEHVSYGTVQTL